MREEESPEMSSRPYEVPYSVAADGREFGAAMPADLSLYELAPVALVCLDEPGCVLAANQATARQLGRAVGYMRGRPFVTMVAQRDRRRLFSHLARVAGGAYCELDLTMEMAHGTELPVTLVSKPVFDGDGRFLCSSNAVLDVSRRQQAESTLRQAKERLDHIAHHDALTGLPNRYLFDDRLTRALARCRRHGWLGALVFVDIDRFKFFNDSYGHDVGDAVLIEAATRLAMSVREHDTVCRFSGDEFLIILENVTSRADVEAILVKLREEFARPLYGLTERPLQLTASFGATLFDKSARDADAIIKQADMAMYEVKQDSRDGIGYFSRQLAAEGERRRLLEADLRIAASETNQLRLEFQPQVDARTQRPCGCEALLRWDHPSQGLIQPGEFIGLAEHASLSGVLTRWVLREACLQARRWLDDGRDFGRVAVNVSPRDLAGSGLVECVDAALESSGLPPSRLEIEVTESSVMHHPLEARRALRQLNARGVRIALDDFGTGYSSLRCLQDYCFDRIKIDRSFVAELGDSAGADAIVQAMVSMARSLGIEVVAEGVETSRQMQHLRRHGVNLMQGFLFSRPVAHEALAALSSPGQAG